MKSSTKTFVEKHGMYKPTDDLLWRKNSVWFVADVYTGTVQKVAFSTLGTSYGALRAQHTTTYAEQ